jgi:hypothetical protein
MSKNTGTSELINYFDLLSSGAVSIAGTIYANDGVELSQVGTALPTNLKNVSGAGIVSFGSNFLGFNENNNLYFSGNSKGYCEFAFNNPGGGRTYTFPSSSGTVALVGGSGVGTVTSVAALTLGTTGTDLSSTVATGTTTPVITLNVPTASASNRGVLSSADWTTFNNKQNTLTNPVTGTGSAGQVAYWSSGSAITGESNLFWDATNDRLGIGTATPTERFEVAGLNGNIRLYGRSGISNNSISSNIYYNGSSWVRDNASFGAAEINFGSSNDSITFSTNSATSGSVTNKMQIFSDGNVLIQNGGTFTNAGYKLDVNGTGRFSSALTANNTITLIGPNATNNTENAASILFDANSNLMGKIVGFRGVNGNDGNLRFYTNNVTPTLSLSLASTGEATFSSSVAVSTFAQFNGTTLRLGNDSNSGYNSIAFQGDSADGNNKIFAGSSTNDGVYIAAKTGQGIRFWVNGSTQALFINSSQSATFSSLGTGTVTATGGTLSTVSDLSYKTDDGFIDSALNKVLNLKPRYFYWNEKSGLPMDIRQLGFYAQEVNEALGEEAANTPADETIPWGITDRSIIAMLTKAIQELKQEIDTLKN